MGKIKNKIKVNKQVANDTSFWGSNIIYDPKFNEQVVVFTSNKLEEANRVLLNLDLPKI